MKRQSGEASSARFDEGDVAEFLEGHSQLSISLAVDAAQLLDPTTRRGLDIDDAQLDLLSTVALAFAKARTLRRSGVAMICLQLTLH
jgi:hypothetical protein